MDTASKGPQIVHQQEVDRAIGQHLSWYWTGKTDEAILQDFGPEVLGEVKSLYRHVMDSPVDFKKYTLEQTLGGLKDQLRQEYPFLSDAALTRLTNCFAYAYK